MSAYSAVHLAGAQQRLSLQIFGVFPCRVQLGWLISLSMAKLSIQRVSAFGSL